MAKLGARKDASFKAISTAPSINKTPVGSSTPPLPYPTVADLSNSVGVVPTVRFNGKPAYVLKRTTQPSCRGDAAGACGGVKSGTVGGEVKPTKGSSTVRVGGKPIIRDGDPCTMNGGNNPGIYVTTPAPSLTPPALAGRQRPDTVAQTPEEADFFDTALDALKGVAQSYRDTVSESLHDFAGDAMDTGGTIAAAGGATVAVGGAVAATGVGAAPGAVIAAGGGATAAVGGVVGGVGAVTESVATGLDAAAAFITTGEVPNLAALGLAYAERMVQKKIDKLTKLIPGKKKPSKQPDDKPKQGKPDKGGGGDDGFRVQGSGGKDDCGIKPYKDQKCPEGQQAHHIVPDYALRYGSRGKGAKGLDRIPGMPSLDDGPTICLSGQAKTQGSEHNSAHAGTDPRIAAAGDRTDNGAKGLALIGEILDISVEEVSKVKPHCSEEIRRKTDEAFKGVDRNKYGRTTQQPPKKGSENRTTLERGERHGTTPNRRRR